MTATRSAWTRLARRGNAPLDALARTTIVVAGRSWAAFQVCGGAGILLGSSLVVFLAARDGLALWLIAAMIAVAVTVFLAVALLTLRIGGAEKLVYYHHEVAVLVAAATFVRATGTSPLPYLDVFVLGLGMFLACGRLGCLMVGCCHGRPGAWGIRYRAEHADAGFTPYYVDVRLIPVQALESLAVLVIVGAGVALAIGPHRPGAVLVWYLGAYGVTRIALEFLRGDPDRRYWCGVSEAQWTSLLQIVSVAASATSAWPAAAVAAVMLAFARARGYRVTHPPHVRELWTAIQSARNGEAARGVAVATTSLGVRISAGRLHYTISQRDEPLSNRTARTLARMILDLGRHPPAFSRLVRGRNETFHLLTGASGRSVTR